MTGRTTGAIATLGTIPDRSSSVSVALGLAYWQWHVQSPAPERLRMAATTLERIWRGRSRTDPRVATLAALGLAETQAASGGHAAAASGLEALRPEGIAGDPALIAAYADGNRCLGRELARVDDLEGAVAAWRRARQAQPDDLPTARGLAHLLEVAGARAARAEDYPGAHRYWTLALEAEPADPNRPSSGRRSNRGWRA